MESLLIELKQLLLDQGYSESIVQSAVLKAKAVPRKRALLKRINKTTLNRPVFAVKFDPRLPAIQSFQAKHWRAMILTTQAIAFSHLKITILEQVKFKSTDYRKEMENNFIQKFNV